MIWFAIGVVAGKLITGSWLAAMAIGFACSVFLGDDDKD